MTASLFLSSLFSPSLPFHLDSCTNNSLSFHVSIIPNWSLRKRERVCGATLFIELRTPLVSSWNQYFEDLDIFFSNIKFRSIYLQEKKKMEEEEKREKLENWFLWNIIEVETSWNISKFLIYFERFEYFFLQY